MLGSTGLFTLSLLATLAPYLLVTMSLNLEYGYGGVSNFGKTLAVAGGAFMAGLIPGALLARIYGVSSSLNYYNDNPQIVSIINSHLSTNIPLSFGIIIVTLIGAIFFGVFLGLLVAYPTKKLRADYLGMTLLAAAQVFLVIGNNYTPLAGGTFGLAIPDPFAWASNYSAFGLTPGEMRNVVAVAFMLVVVLIVFLFVRKLTHSPLGRLLRAIRDDENSALALGKDVERKRLTVMIIASAIAAIAGALYAFYTANVISTSFSLVDWTFWPWVMVILGGAANDIGVVVGTFIFVAVRQTIVFYKYVFAPFLPFDVVWLDTLLLGLALIFILIYRPQGLIPEKPIKTVNSQPSLETQPSIPADSDPLLERLKRAITAFFKRIKPTDDG